MKELDFIDKPETLSRVLKQLKKNRESAKVKTKRSYSLDKMERIAIWQKTDGNCHICGMQVDENEFEADHVKNHSSGGNNEIDNFLAACKTCNNYRWHYSPEEVQWILKIGVWAKTKIDLFDSVGKFIAKSFVKKEIEREKRRKHPRMPKQI